MMMKRQVDFTLKFFVTLFLMTIYFPAFAQEKKAPNIIVFIGDDVGYGDQGCYGNQIIKTPHIDNLALNGLRFRNAFLTASSCSPSRISIMTGRYPHNTGAAELHTKTHVALATIASMLKQKGYYTGQAGKWHMGEEIKKGFDDIDTSESIKENGGEEHWLKSLQKRDRSKPFFFWFASHDSHRPWGPNDLSGTNQPRDVVPPITLANGPETKTDLAKYYDEISRLDHYIHEVEKELEKQGELKNTIIVFMSDNGRPFPRDKTRVYDIGMQTPLIVKWEKGNLKKGTTNNSLISAIDIAPTLLAAAKIEAPASMQGKSFLNVIKNPALSFRKHVFSEHNWHDYEAHERAVRTQDFLYVLNSRPQLANQGPADAVTSPSFEELKELRNRHGLSSVQADIFMAPRPKEELYDVRKDKLQIHNLAFNPLYQIQLKTLRACLKKWMKDTGDNIPDSLTKDWYDRETGQPLKHGFGIRGEMPGTKTNAISNNNKGDF